MKQIERVMGVVLIFLLLMDITMQGVHTDAATISKSAQASKAAVATNKAESEVRLQGFDVIVAQNLLNLAVKENAKVKKLGVQYAKIYSTLNKKLKFVAAKIAQRRTQIEKVEFQKAAAQKAAKEKAIANKAEQDALAKAAAEKSAAEKVAAEQAKITTSAALEIHGFYSGFTKYDMYSQKYLKGLTTVSFAWMKLESYNGLMSLAINDKKHDFHYPDDNGSVLKFCKENNIKAQIAIYADGNLVKPFIAQQESRTRLIDSIISSLKVTPLGGETFDFSGVTIDFEGFKQQDTKEYFSQFLNELKPRLTAINKKLYVVVNVLENYPGYDYKEILKVSDKVILMAHDYGPKTSITREDVNKYINYNNANPIRSLAPIKKVQYALEELTDSCNEKSDLKKILLQISFGTAQWQFNVSSPEDWTTLISSAVGVYAYPTYTMIKDRIENKDRLGTNFLFGYINELESPYMTYYNASNRTLNFILYEDDRSVTAKMKLAKTEGIGGISIWRLGTMPDFVVESKENVYLDVWDTIIKGK